MSEIGNVDVARLRERANEIRELLPANASGATLRIFSVSVPLDEIESLLEAYERMIHVKCRSCGADQSGRRGWCQCENDE